MTSTLLLLCLSALASAHTAAWADGMYCRGGNVTGVDDSNTNTPVNPLYMLPKEEWWFQRDRNCPDHPPPDGEFLNLPAGGSFTVELAHNRAQTTLSWGGKYTSEWPDGGQHPENWGPDSGGCLSGDGAMHTVNQSDAAGTAFAISYNPNMADVTIDNLVVFTVLPHTPWHRIATYQVPQALPPCPPGGCICAWLWVPNGCGISNMYMQGFKCNVTDTTSTVPVAPAQAPVYCKDQPNACVKGPKQMIAWHQLSGDNIVVPSHESPGYNEKCGWSPGAQTDIFEQSSPISNTTVAQPVDTASSISPTLSNAVDLAISASSSAPVSIPTADVVPPNNSVPVTPGSNPTATPNAHGDNCHHDVAKYDTLMTAKSSTLADPVFVVDTATSSSTSTPVSMPTQAADVVVPPNNGTSVTLGSNPTATPDAHKDNCHHGAPKSSTLMTLVKPDAKSTDLADPVLQAASSSTSTPVNPGSIPTNPAYYYV